MGGAKSTPKTQTASSVTHVKHARECGPMNVQMVQNVLLIWLDNNIEENSSNCQKTIRYLRCAVNAVNVFTDDAECIQFLEDMAGEKVCMIISGALGQKVVPRVHDLSQTDSIFIFCHDKTYHEEWAKKWPKIKGVHTEIKSICDALKQVAQQCEQNAASISIMDANDTLPNKSLDQLDPSFIYTLIMKEILLTINFEQQHITEFIEHCRQALHGNSKELKLVDQLAGKYHKQTPIWWYTLESFLYPMLNRALRTLDAGLMIKLGFFLADLHRQIQELHQEQFGDHGSNQKFLVYRGQGMEKADFEKMVASKGGLISFNCFLSTSRTDHVSLGFANRAISNPQLFGVLFVMAIDPTLPDTPFASVGTVGAMGGKEDEILFSMNTVFRIGSIEQLDNHPRFFQVELTMTSEKDNDLRRLIDYIREETSQDKQDGWYRLGSVLWKLGEATKAQQVYEILLQQTTAERHRGPIYHQLGIMANVLGHYDEAIVHYEKSIRINEKQKPCDHLNLAKSYNNIGIVYQNTGDFPKALSTHKKVLALRQQSLPPTHPDLAPSYNNIGSVYQSMGDYPKALSSYERALTIQQQSLPPTHPDLASSYNNIGSVYQSMGDYVKAVSSYEKALAIKKQSLPPTHPDLAMTYTNIGNVYDSMGDYLKALSSHEEALTIRQQSLSPTHPHLASSYNNIGLVYQNMGDYSKALSALEKALTIQQQSLPPTHSDLATSYNNIGLVYASMGDYPKAFSSHEKALAIRQQSLPPTHPHLASSYNNIGEAFRQMGDYPKALSSHEKALAIKRQSLPPTHPDLASSYNNIGLVYASMSDYPKALSSHEKALAIRQQSLPPTHPHLASSYNNIGEVFRQMGDYPKALTSHEKTLIIQQQSLPSTHPDLAIPYNNIGLVYQNMGNYPKALSSLENALAIQQQSLPPTHPHLAMTYFKIGFLHENMKNYWKAHSFYERAVDMASRSLPPDHPHLQIYRYTMVSKKN